MPNTMQASTSSSESPVSPAVASSSSRIIDSDELRPDSEFPASHALLPSSDIGSAPPAGVSGATASSPVVPPLALGANPRRIRPSGLDDFYNESLPSRARRPRPGPFALLSAVTHPHAEAEEEDDEVPPPPPYRVQDEVPHESSDSSDDFEVLGVITAPPRSPTPPPTKGKGKKRAQQSVTSTPSRSPTPPPTAGKGKKRAQHTPKEGPTKKPKTSSAGPSRRSARQPKPVTDKGSRPLQDLSAMDFPPVRRPPRLTPRDRTPPVASSSSQGPGPSRARQPRRSRSTPFSSSPTEDEDEDGLGVQEVDEEEEEEGEGPPPFDDVAFPNPQPPAVPDTASIFQPVEQRRAISQAQDGKSLFVTGPAGSGKTSTLVLIRQVLIRKYGKKATNVATVAATNNAALCCDGETYHSFFGFAPNDVDIDTAYRRSSRNRRKIAALQAILIDEVSQLSKKTFQLLSDLLAKVKNNTLPFGGIQVVCFGDFLQLPPLPDTVRSPVEYAFESTAWTRTIGDRMVSLKTDIVRSGKPNCPRQKEFRAALEQVRRGVVSDKTVRFFEGLARPLPRNVIPTQLFARKKDVDAANEAKLHKLAGYTTDYLAHDSFSNFEEFEFNRYLDSTNAPKKLSLKENSQVVFLKSDSARGEFIKPGTHGVIMGLADAAKWEKVQAVAKELKPPAYTVTVGTGIRDKNVMWPVVKSKVANNRDVYALVMKSEWRLEVDRDRFMERLQVPLRLCWASSIHSVQGRTLNAVQANLGKVFECGQAYVALSRVADPEKLQIMNFDPSQIRGQADSTVLKFYGFETGDEDDQ